RSGFGLGKFGNRFLKPRPVGNMRISLKGTRFSEGDKLFGVSPRGGWPSRSSACSARTGSALRQARDGRAKSPCSAASELLTVRLRSPQAGVDSVFKERARGGGARP